MGNWNILTLAGKELELVDKAKRYHLDIVGVSSTKRRGSRIVDLDGGWKHFYYGADPSMSAKAGEEILTTPRLSDCMSDWIPLGSWVCMLNLMVLDRSLCLFQVYAPDATSEHQSFVDEVNDALLRLPLEGFLSPKSSADPQKTVFTAIWCYIRSELGIYSC